MQLAGSVIPNVRKIAVLRANAIGDFIFVLPALHALRAAYAQAEIVLLGQEWHARFLENRPGPIDRVLVVPPSQGVNETTDGHQDPAALERFFQSNRAEGFDLALQLHGGGRFSNPFTRRLGARITAGLRTGDAEPLDRWVPYVYFQNEMLRYLEVVSLVGAPPVTLEPSLCVTQRDRIDSRFVDERDDQRLVVLHIGAGDARRRWPAVNFARVADELVARGARVAIIGTDRDQSAIDVFTAAVQSPVDNCCGRLTLGGIAGLCARSALVISNDSGPLHLAHAVGARTVGIYWGMNVLSAGPLWRTRHRPLIAWETECPECGADRATVTCGHTASLVASVTIESVLQAGGELLSI